MNPAHLFPLRRCTAPRLIAAALFFCSQIVPAISADDRDDAEAAPSVGDEPTPGRIAPKPTKVIAPQHPPELWTQRVTGNADIECLVTVDGKVADAKVVKASRPEFGEAALAAVRQWEFEPGKRNGVVSAMLVRVPLNFAIGDEDSLEGFLGRKLFDDVPGEIVKAETLTKWPMPKQLIEPKYPPSLRGTGKKGKAVVSIVITPEGKVINPKIVKATYPEFTFPALAAAASLEFPAQSKRDREKNPLYVGMNVQFDFDAEGGRPPAAKKAEAKKQPAGKGKEKDKEKEKKS